MHAVLAPIPILPLRAPFLLAPNEPSAEWTVSPEPAPPADNEGKIPFIVPCQHEPSSPMASLDLAFSVSTAEVDPGEVLPHTVVLHNQSDGASGNLAATLRRLPTLFSDNKL